MEPVSNVGRFTRILLIIIGIVLIVAGTFVSTMQITSIGEKQTNAVITGFKKVTSDDAVSTDHIVTLVTYEIDGQKYENIQLGQFEEQWRVGDRLTLLYDKDYPENVKTKTMTYIGFIIMIASLPFIIIGIYTLSNLNRRAAKTPEEIAEDEERTTAGKLKYKVSSIVISLAAGIPVMIIGLAFMYLEHNSVFGLLCIILGAIATLGGLRSVVLFIIIKYRHRKEFNRMIRNSRNLLPPPDEQTKK